MHTWWRVNLSDWCWVSSAPWEYFHRYAHVAKLTKISATWRSTRSMQTQSWRLSCPCIPDTLRTLKPSSGVCRCVSGKKKFLCGDYWNILGHDVPLKILHGRDRGQAELENEHICRFSNDIQSLSLPSCTSCLDVHSCKVVTSRKGSLVEKFIWNFSNSLLLQSSNSNPNWPETCQLPTFFLFEHCGFTARWPCSQVPQPTCSWKWHPDTCQLGNPTMTLLLNAVHIADQVTGMKCPLLHPQPIFNFHVRLKSLPWVWHHFFFLRGQFSLYWIDLMILTL